MTRNTRTLVVVGAAMASAALASYGVYRTIQQMPVRQVQVVERVQIVAAQPVPVGMLLTPEMVKAVPWPANSVIAGGFSAPADVVGRGVTAPILENEPVTESKLAPKGSGGGMVTTIPQGMRAMAVRVNDVIGVAGFAVPGTRVDVVVTVKNDRESISRTVISNIQVLTAGTNFDTDKSKNGNIPSAVVTLLVTPPDAEKLALATTQGQIVLALRNPLDTAPTESMGAHMANLLGGPNPPPVAAHVSGPTRAVAAPAAPPPPPKEPILILRGGKPEIIKQEIIK
jgi:pilus assembly protein CpaB